ncbi:MAG: PIG-L family deacetylase [Actinomycetota bacterium]|nr:PIG-L family deacetylase [Actinomycetota bacterium]
MLTVLHVAPHPDDESIGAPCSLLQLASTGARVVVVACALGRASDRARRHRELVEASRVGGFELVVRDPPAALGSRDDLPASRRTLTPWLAGLIDEHCADLVISPQLHDVHPAHETVAEAVRDAIVRSRRPPIWWAWGIWSDLRNPTLLFPCAAMLQQRAERMLACHRGELARNDYAELVRAAGRLAATRGVERVLGFGSAALPGVHHAELFTELGWVDHRWRFGVPRVSPDLALPGDWGSDATRFVTRRSP